MPKGNDMLEITVIPTPMVVGQEGQVSVIGLDPDLYVNLGTGLWRPKEHGKGEEFVAGWVFGMGMPDADGNFGPLPNVESQVGTVTFYVKQKGHGPWSQDPDATLDVEIIEATEP